MEKRFNDFGAWRLPEKIEKLDSSPENLKSLEICHVFCPEGHSLVSNEEELAGQPGILLGFTRPNGEKGRVLISTHLEDLSKKVLEGELVHAERIELFCPTCGKSLPVLAECDRCHTGDMCVLYCSPSLTIEDSVAFCNVVGCPNAMLIKSEKIIRAIEREKL